jgi:hypothetical protein
MSGAVTYNLFRHRRDPAILCAVPNDKPVPAFISRSAWSFERVIRAGGEPVDSFEPALAEIAGNLNGFYLFLALGRAFDKPFLSVISVRDLQLAELLAA